MSVERVRNSSDFESTKVYLATSNEICAIDNEHALPANPKMIFRAKPIRATDLSALASSPTLLLEHVFRDMTQHEEGTFIAHRYER